jgi:hypothetical protein
MDGARWEIVVEGLTKHLADSPPPISSNCYHAEKACPNIQTRMLDTVKESRNESSYHLPSFFFVSFNKNSVTFLIIFQSFVKQAKSLAVKKFFLNNNQGRGSGLIQSGSGSSILAQSGSGSSILAQSGSGSTKSGSNTDPDPDLEHNPARNTRKPFVVICKT